MPNEPYVAITPAGLNALATNTEIAKIIAGVSKIFRENNDLVLPVTLIVKYVDGDIVVELVEDNNE